MISVKKPETKAKRARARACKRRVFSARLPFFARGVRVCACIFARHMNNFFLLDNAFLNSAYLLKSIELNAKHFTSLSRSFFDVKSCKISAIFPATKFARCCSQCFKRDDAAINAKRERARATETTDS